MRSNVEFTGHPMSIRLLDRFLDNRVKRVVDEEKIREIWVKFTARWTTSWWATDSQRGAAIAVWIDALNPCTARRREVYLKPGWTGKHHLFVRAADRLHEWASEQIHHEECRGIVMDLVQEIRPADPFSPEGVAFYEAGHAFRTRIGLRSYLDPITEKECRTWIGWLRDYRAGRVPTTEGVQE
jgi:hypothetical protein